MRLLNALAIGVIVNGFPVSTTRSSDEFSSRRTKSPLDIFNGRLSCYNCQDKAVHPLNGVVYYGTINQRCYSDHSRD